MTSRAKINLTVAPLTTRLVAPRLSIRAPRAADVPALRLLLRKNADHLRPVSPLPRPGEDPASLTGLATTVARQRTEWRQDRAYAFLITLRHPDRPIIGRVALTSVVRGGFQNCYLGYWVDSSHQGRGFATEAVQTILGFAFGALGLHRVQAAIMPRNVASLRVIAKLGFRHEGLAKDYLSIAGAWEDHLIFARTSSDFIAAEPAASPAKPSTGE